MSKQCVREKGKDVRMNVEKKEKTHEKFNKTTLFYQYTFFIRKILEGRGSDLAKNDNFKTIERHLTLDFVKN